jgi:hypothetical protein
MAKRGGIAANITTLPGVAAAAYDEIAMLVTEPDDRHRRHR